MLDKTYDFLEAEGQATETGCVPSSNTCGSSGQNALDGPNWCSDDYESIEITYYVAPTVPIDIKGNKSIVGVGDKGVIRGKGIRLVNDISNVIIQNVHFTVSKLPRSRIVTDVDCNRNSTLNTFGAVTLFRCRALTWSGLTIAR